MTETIFIKIKKTSKKNWKKLNSAKCENGPGACENSEDMVFDHNHANKSHGVLGFSKDIQS